MFEPEILGLSASTLTGFVQSLITPALGFAFLYLMQLQLPKLPHLPDGVVYKPPLWVLPLFAHGSMFAVAGLASAAFFLGVLRDTQQSPAVGAELFLHRDLETKDPSLADVTFALASYDGFSDFRVLVNGYQVFGSYRDCVTSFQCKPKDDAKAREELAAFKELRLSGGSIYDTTRLNPLGERVSLKHHLAAGRNHIEIISTNSGTGGCEATAEIALHMPSRQPKAHLLRILPHAGPRPPPKRDLTADEAFHAVDNASEPGLVEPYKTLKKERRNAVCERIRIVMHLERSQAATLSDDTAFAAHFNDLQAAYVCATIGKPMAQCEVKP
jgi:hypothetical protein